MTVTLQSTTKIVEIIINGQSVPARIWEGVTERGVVCHAYITRIAAQSEADTAEFDRDLKSHRPPSALVDQVIPLRMVL